MANRYVDGVLMPDAVDLSVFAESVGSIRNRMTAAVQSHLDQSAKARGYDGIVSACSYAGAPNAFQAESVAFLTWRAAVWVRCYEVLAEVEGGIRPIPTESEIISLLPAFVAP